MHMPTKIGLRTIKTALAAALCALIYYFLDASPAFACIGAVFGMGDNPENSKKHGGNRLFGTMIGGFLGMALFRIYLIFHPEGDFIYRFFTYLIIKFNFNLLIWKDDQFFK